MARDLTQILVVDVEATCYEEAFPHGEEQEIIEIGICLLDPEDGVRSDRCSLIVRPEHSRVSPFCTRLTTLTQAAVDQGVSLRDACAVLRKRYRSDRRAWASFGYFDQNLFRLECARKAITYPFDPSHINVRHLFSTMAGRPREAGLDEALDLLGFPMEGTWHRGVDDAWNIARILRACLSGETARLRALPAEVPCRMVAELYRTAEAVFGDVDRARSWLGMPNRELDGAVPFSLLGSSVGAAQIGALLGRMATAFRAD